MGNKFFVIMLASLFSVGMLTDAVAQKKKTVAQASKKYVKYVKGQAQGKTKIAQKNASDPATVTRDKSDTTIVDVQEDPMRTAFEEFSQKARNEYEDFRQKANREYAEFMKQAWKSFGSKPAVPQPKEEEIPPVVIKEEEIQKPKEDKPLPVINFVVAPLPEPQPLPIAPIREQPAPTPTVQQSEFSVYGTPMKVRFYDGQRFSLKDVSRNTISETWKKMSLDSYNNTIRDCLEIRVTRNLSDWAYLNMLSKFAESCFGKTNEATLLMAYLYCQSGYQMRLATADGKLRMLYAAKQHIYDKAYYDIDDVRYYLFDGNERALNICDIKFPGEKAMSLYITKPQKFDEDMSEERELLSLRYTTMQLKVQVNKNLVDFYDGYPVTSIDNNFMTRWSAYANTPLDKTVTEKLYPALKKILKDRTEEGAAERILNWVQTAFIYGYDSQIWGCDRAFFAEETLFYPYCDCEDRSILFSRLIRDLLGLDVVLVYYPGHLATAVHFNMDVKGDYIMHDGKKFVVCDPTYVGAPAGMTMPGMDNAKATVILLSKD